MKKVKPNPTDARTLALYFLKLTAPRTTPQIIARTVIQVKAVLQEGYTLEEVTSVIDYTIDRNAGVYSFGYIAACMNDTLRILKTAEEKSRIKEQAILMREQMAATFEERREEARVDNNSTERNRRKAEQSRVQSGFGKKSYFDMFEGK